MAAGDWYTFTSFKKNVGSGTIDLTAVSPAYNMSLHSSAANLSGIHTGISSYLSVPNEVVSGNNYSTGGKPIECSWSINGTAYVFRLSSNVVFTASGGNISDIRYLVVRGSGNQLVAWGELTTAAFDLTDGNTLTINAGNIFTMTGSVE